MITYIDKIDVINIIKHSIMNNGHAENSKEIFNIIINYSKISFQYTEAEIWGKIGYFQVV